MCVRPHCEVGPGARDAERSTYSDEDVAFLIAQVKIMLSIVALSFSVLLADYWSTREGTDLFHGIYPYLTTYIA